MYVLLLITSFVFISDSTKNPRLDLKYTSLCPDPISRDILVIKSDHDSVPYTCIKMYEIVQ